MSAFSERLHAYVTRADMKIAVLSKLSGVDRSFIQKCSAESVFPVIPLYCPAFPTL